MSQMGTAPPIFPACENRHSNLAFRPEAPGSNRERLDSRDQARWLSTDRPKGRTACSPVYPQRPRLVGSVSSHHRGRVTQPECSSSSTERPCCSASTALAPKHDDEVQFYAFDVLMSEGDDLRPLPLHLRKNHLAKMLRWRVDGIILNDFEQGEIGPDLFRHACLMGLEGIVSKQKDQPYRAGRSSTGSR